MSTERTAQRRASRGSASPVVAWTLLAGGVIFFVGGSMHPKEDPAGVSAKEHLLVMYQDPAWYSAHALLVVGMFLIAAALVMLVRGPTLAGSDRAQLVGKVAALTAVLGAAGTLLHLIAAIDADRIAAHQGTPITDVMGVVETLTVPAFGFGIATLAVVGALTRTLGNWLIAVPGVIGGIGYGLAGGAILFTDRLDFLFPRCTEAPPTR
ncbi:MAG: hypothetical protein LH645_02720 [Actinomycetia bacterium]|nr:hypothetical protein [Actinomycetes bacterium]